MNKAGVSALGQLFVSPDGVAFLGPAIPTELHRHFTASVTLCIEGTLRMRTALREPFRPVFGFAALPNMPQQVEGSDSTLILNMQVDPETEAFARLSESLWRDAPSHELSEAVATPLRDQVAALMAEGAVRGQTLWRVVLDALGGPAKGPRRYDPRIARVLEILKAAMPEAPSTRQLGQQVGLSEGRLIHLFSQQVGVPLRRYVLWLRIRHIVFCAAIGQNLTDAAHEAGFADSAHLTRVFRSMFGMAPSQILRSERVNLSLEVGQLPLSGPHAVQDRARTERVLAEISKNNPWLPRKT